MVKAKQRKIAGLIKYSLQELGIRVATVILFGSRINGNPHKDSDLDIVVLSKDFARKNIFKKAAMVHGVHRQLVKLLAMPLDLLYYSPSEWEMSNSPVVYAAKSSGVQFS